MIISPEVLKLFREQAVTISRCGSNVTIATDRVAEADLIADWLVSLAAPIELTTPDPERMKALDALAEQAQELGMGY